MSAHTPGPWEVGSEGNGKPGYVYCNNSLGSAVAIVFGKPLRLTVFSPEEEEANARLIAAAPDLLAALKFAQSIIGHPDDAGSQLIADAIAKAEGK
jgi:hypothetical protein